MSPTPQRKVQYRYSFNVQSSSLSLSLDSSRLSKQLLRIDLKHTQPQPQPQHTQPQLQLQLQLQAEVPPVKSLIDSAILVVRSNLRPSLKQARFVCNLNSGVLTFTTENCTFVHMKIRKIQLEMLRKEKSAYGGELLKTRKGREHARPLTVKHSMHLVLRSTKAVGKWAFNKKKNQTKIEEIVSKFTLKYGVKVFSFANVGNHLHFHIKLSNRRTYDAFIRGLTSAIAMAVTGRNRWNRPTVKNKERSKFWDYRPYTKFVETSEAFLNLRHYLKVNELEGRGCTGAEARYLLLKFDSA